MLSPCFFIHTHFHTAHVHTLCTGLKVCTHIVTITHTHNYVQAQTYMYTMSCSHNISLAYLTLSESWHRKYLVSSIYDCAYGQ